MKLNEIGRPKRSNRPVKRRGRGGASGHGGTSTRGHKGQKARSGGGVRPGFEGGQMPLIRRIPKFGFTPLHKKSYQVLNLRDLNGFAKDSLIDEKTLRESGLIKSSLPVKILAEGELKVSLQFKVSAFSKKAIEKITSAGGQIISNPLK
ncbi:MAG: 50S ribosomal protein L15 [bacterium (Candidatus Ratteibacteria) CG23_combo_of_CG06-09_8_20_14_all_48_7]|uniref:Large ribosomal subunit protein uL15 n=1 Tax=bacterium (Candidatus Ratteibacteria) CG23_combo_of_CG06-09_8_20_14_all_48_7 TaxID=2014292 RepID=A0A2G9YBY9_9BACT|nr:MAG: 50S ribosomal protein L15 [bacterium (Candidatus Ratteibacteria) CG23_combo_of_CG06-09_8_20_14_all_48_7]